MADRLRLTQRMIAAAKADAHRVTFLWDSELRGFGCKIETTGTKSFVLQYRNAEGRPKPVVADSAD